MENNSSFTTGFALGLFSGVVGYYLFGTKRGEKIRYKLAKEWQAAHQHLAEQGVLDGGVSYDNLGDLLQSAKKEFLRAIDYEIAEPEKKSKKKSSTHKKRSYNRHTQQKQFKGI